MTLSQEKRVCLGAFAGAHGVKGEAKIKTFTSQTAAIAEYGPVESEDGKQQFTLRFIRELKPSVALVRSAQISSREMAAALAGTRLYVNRERLEEPQEEGEYFYTDLIGLRVLGPEDELLGEVMAVQNYGAGDILEIGNIPGQKGRHLVPFREDAVPLVNMTEKFIRLSTDYLPQNAKSSQDDGKNG